MQGNLWENVENVGNVGKVENVRKCPPPALHCMLPQPGKYRRTLAAGLLDFLQGASADVVDEAPDRFLDGDEWVSLGHARVAGLQVAMFEQIIN